MPIAVLSPQLANQIAAGEVVERPASVIKELIENSLDAGATRIDIDVERGGRKLIRIRDDGCGIPKEELPLALARHATSKIASLDDLESIASLGFRGEALASISSVSRLTLTSRPQAQTEGWQAYAEGRDMNVDVRPAPHPVGTTIEVLDLFYNTPARRKFLRTDKTEFGHIDEVVRRIALAKMGITLNLTHNGRIVHQLRGAQSLELQAKRLCALCGHSFVKEALEVSWQHGDMSIHGWILAPGARGQYGELQYSYVNGRITKDRLINHAIRQAYQSELPAGQQPVYVLHIEVDPHEVDVNVHPTKHEVRFHQSRLVHDFIYQAVATALHKAQAMTQAPLLAEDKNGDDELAIESRPVAGKNSFNEPLPASVENPLDYYSQLQLREPSDSQEKNDTREPGSRRASESNSRSNAVREPAKQYVKTAEDIEKQALTQQLYGELIQSPQDNAEVKSAFAEKTALFPEKRCSVNELPNFYLQKTGLGKVLTIWNNSYAIVEYDSQLALLSLNFAERTLKTVQLSASTGELVAQPLLVPLKMTLSDKEKQLYSQFTALFTQLGMKMSWRGVQATLQSVCLPLRQQNLQQLVTKIFNYLAQERVQESTDFIYWLAGELASETKEWTQSQAVRVISELERLAPERLRAPCGQLLQPIDLLSAMRALHDE